MLPSSETLVWFYLFVVVGFYDWAGGPQEWRWVAVVLGAVMGKVSLPFTILFGAGGILL